MNAQFLLGLV